MDAGGHQKQGKNISGNASIYECMPIAPCNVPNKQMRPRIPYLSTVGIPLRSSCSTDCAPPFFSSFAVAEAVANFSPPPEDAAGAEAAGFFAFFAATIASRKCTRTFYDPRCTLFSSLHSSSLDLLTFYSLSEISQSIV
jgi:hypothetical protein